MHIAFIGFGEAARAFAGSFRERDGGIAFSAYDILLGTGDDASMRAAAEALGVLLAERPEEAVANADWVICAVTAASSFEAGRSVAGAVGAGQVYIDINSVSAGVKQQTAALFAENGCAYIDMAVMSPVHPRGHRSPVLIAGAIDGVVLDALDGYGFAFETVGTEPGMAATVKMVRSLFVKGLEAISVQTMIAAHRAGCLDRVRGLAGADLSAIRLGPFRLLPVRARGDPWRQARGRNARIRRCDERTRTSRRGSAGFGYCTGAGGGWRARPCP
ncbi:NAD(P)-binding domain-containing protein [Chelativorans sp. EGI FJ00035]|uniref:NAD(P)-binding domain-containing protein n=1 Tax=Chelativorans salis TaxID=2978478 RepID=A0ABT2LV24_9HYPH|nr:NAD(P)-binding domain-containing protein [Chelativorans sp. EGI FJ00035]MCT7378383.1 NAD(P)-binding domain-containing protein [Chelativorans sp. EGI FJ00035]